MRSNKCKDGQKLWLLYNGRNISSGITSTVTEDSNEMQMVSDFIVEMFYLIELDSFNTLKERYKIT